MSAESPAAKTHPLAMPAKLGRYRILSRIATGGMGAVYLGRAEGPSGYEKLVAVKAIHGHLAEDGEFIEMFLDEARIASLISHPNVCSVFDFGETDGVHYLAMEYLLGEPLTKVIRAMNVDPGRIPPERMAVLAARIVADACEGLHAAHELRDTAGNPLNVVHRDVTPHNLFLTWDGGVRVVDFGIASAANRLHTTRTGTVKGKFAYLAPEMLRGEQRADRRADVWSLGVVLWELCTLRPLFRRETDTDTLLAVAIDQIAPPSTVRNGIPEGLDAIVARAVSRNLGDRYPTARALGRDLSRFVAATGEVIGLAELSELMRDLFPEGEQRQRTTIAELASGVAQPVPSAGSLDAGTGSRVRSTRARSSRRWSGIASIAVAGALIAAGAFWLGAATEEPARVEPAPSEPRAPASVPVAEPPPPPSAAPEEIRTETEETAPVVEQTTAEEVPSRRRRHVGEGTVNVVTPGGWAYVYRRGRRLGQTPARITLPAGRHTLEIEPFGEGRRRRVRVTVTAGEVVRVSEPLAR